MARGLISNFFVEDLKKLDLPNTFNVYFYFSSEAWIKHREFAYGGYEKTTDYGC